MEVLTSLNVDLEAKLNEHRGALADTTATLRQRQAELAALTKAGTEKDAELSEVTTEKANLLQQHLAQKQALTDTSEALWEREAALVTLGGQKAELQVLCEAQKTKIMVRERALREKEEALNTAVSAHHQTVEESLQRELLLSSDVNEANAVAEEAVLVAEQQKVQVRESKVLCGM